MSAPNRFDVVELLANRLNPDLRTGTGADRFTTSVAATLHYGSPGLGIRADANWGRRRNPSGALSNDVIQYRESGENFDIITAAGSDFAHIGWSPSTPGEWVAPEIWDVVHGDDPTPEPEPEPDPGTVSQTLAVLREIRDVQMETRTSQQTTEQYTFAILDLLRRTAQRFGIPV